MTNWLSTSPSSGNGSNMITVTALPNTGGTRNANVLINGNETSVSVSVEQKNGPYELMPMTFKIASAGTINWYHRRTLLDDVGYLTIQYRINEGQWTSLTATSAGTSFNVAAGDVVEFKGDNVRYGTLPLSYTTFSGSTAVFEAYGNTMSLIDSVNYSTVENLTQQYAFNRLFAGCTGLTSAENLIMPTTVIPMHVYTSMFEGCTSLTTSPLLPGIAPDNSSYNEMFKGCTSLNNVRCLATDVSNYHCTYNWLSGVSQTGTFTKAASMTGWSTGNDGIPSGWTVVDYADDNWLSLSQTAGTNNAIIEVTALPNPGLLREKTLFVSGNTKNVMINIVQESGYGSWDYLTFIIRTSGDIYWSGSKGISYSINDGDWTDLYGGNSFSVSRNDVIRFKGDNDTYSGCTFSGSTADFDLQGNVMSVINSVDFNNLTTIPSGYCFVDLFSHTNVVNASGLTLPATGLTSFCYGNMFGGCSGLTSTPLLPATAMIDGCYNAMFAGCTSLTTAPVLPSMSLDIGCYEDMFNGCTGLTTAPTLPATTVFNACYNAMFAGCTSLTTAPDLPADTLDFACYERMFSGCTNLNYIKCLATDHSASFATQEWVSGVASSGTFVKASSATWDTGINGIPNNWTVQNA